MTGSCSAFQASCSWPSFRVNLSNVFENFPLMIWEKVIKDLIKFKWIHHSLLPFHFLGNVSGSKKISRSSKMSEPQLLKDSTIFLPVPICARPLLLILGTPSLGGSQRRGRGWGGGTQVQGLVVGTPVFSIGSMEI